MKEKGNQIEETIRFSITDDVLACTKLDIDEVKEHIYELVLIFKGDYKTFFSTKITDNPTLDTLFCLSDNLQRLKKCKGFEKHIKNFKSDAFHSNFVTILSGFLVSKVDELILEPPIDEKLKRSDIYLNLKGEEIYIECKSINTEQFDYSDEHKSIFEILNKFINTPHQIDIKYRTSLSKIEIEKLGATLQDRLPKITNDGKIINNKNLEVMVSKRKNYQPGYIPSMIEVTMRDLYENCYYPMHIFINKYSIAISGPRIDFSKILMKKIKDSRRQSVPGKSYILAIDANNMLGDYSENLRRISTSFQPNTNTRFSGIVLVRYFSDLESNDIEFNFIPNPYANYPTSEKFKSLFRK